MNMPTGPSDTRFRAPGIMLSASCNLPGPASSCCFMNILRLLTAVSRNWVYPYDLGGNETLPCLGVLIVSCQSSVYTRSHRGVAGLVDRPRRSLCHGAVWSPGTWLVHIFVVRLHFYLHVARSWVGAQYEVFLRLLPRIGGKHVAR